MPLHVSDILPFSEARSQLSRLVDEVQQGAEKIITKNGEPAVALIDARRLDHYHRLERARIHLLLLEDVVKGLDDVDAGRTLPADEAMKMLRQRRRGSKA
ncbi:MULTISPECIES: type II toxin-antitoxin system Phd/YefM family antitoxin [Hydrogenophaga]|jgi:prevent-host-death family protein|uniref:Antitoxin n=1 Tax=Hydrogenophaga intermedia TaxID=65786 RepID=A0A1L1PHG3_HYDIT|nr:MULTISPECIES: type II toxin-antitoxin system Phd/YefM family antitoxin [Hydrogenophaga]AOS79065.1 prevent-host-death protein [Hydrogenophaga sp. PBC]TMU74593.1 type II toxin-antitoxin system Phd/YefM family antitoxin [Hydrogenophaga intermedia]CDN88214.1 Prevent-host-death family protein [Hydrogenophaga intermedia]